MGEQGEEHRHSHAHDHTHAVEQGFPHGHDAGEGHTSRRDFLRVLMGGALAGASVIELAMHRAAWASTAAPTGGPNIFDIQKVADGVYFAHARPQTMINCNGAIFVRSKDVVVVDAHSKPSAAAALIAQIKREVTPNPVRFLINTHFHWDHTQGNQAYTMTGEKVERIATNATKELMEKNAVARMKASVDAIPAKIDAMRARAAASTSAAEKAFCAAQIRHMQSYVAEMKSYTMELPTITFDKSYLLQDAAFDLHLEFLGHAHTAGDIFTFCPRRKAVATGDAIHGWLPTITDGYPRLWPKTVDEVGKAEFKYLMGGHGPVQSDRIVMMSQRNYIEELAEKVEAGKKAGLTVAELQQRLTVASLKSLQSNGYEAFLTRTITASNEHFGPMPPLQDGVNENINDVYKNIDWV